MPGRKPLPWHTLTPKTGKHMQNMQQYLLFYLMFLSLNSFFFYTMLIEFDI